MIKDFELSTRFPFGFFKHRRRLPARETELNVFPGVLPFDEADNEIPIDTGEFTANKRGIGQDLLALREYQPNDDLRRIDWKATARTRRLTVREFAAEDEKRVTVALLTRTPENIENPVSLRDKLSAEQRGETMVESERFELGASLAASILLHYAEENAELRLIIDNDASDFGSDRSHLHDLLKRLSAAEPELSNVGISPELAAELERILIVSDDSHCFLVSPHGTSGLSATVRQRLKIIQT
jgi:uncharacterized protein (DUF58 family)